MQWPTRDVSSHARREDSAVVSRSWPRTSCLTLLSTQEMHFSALSPVPWMEAEETSHSWGWTADVLLHISQAFIFGLSVWSHLEPSFTALKHLFKVYLKFRIHKEGPKSIKSRGDLTPLFFSKVSWICLCTFSLTLGSAADFYPFTESNKKIAPRDYYPGVYSHFHWHGWEIDFKGNFIMLYCW